MMLRRFVAVLNLALFALAVVAEILLPAYSTFIFYGLLLWMFATLFLFFGPNRDRSFGGARPSATSAPSASAPLPSGPRTSVGFCVYCGTTLGAGSAVCPSCGKPVSPI
jgi:hypothetical protein